MVDASMYQMYLLRSLGQPCGLLSGLHRGRYSLGQDLRDVDLGTGFSSGLFTGGLAGSAADHHEVLLQSLHSLDLHGDEVVLDKLSLGGLKISQDPTLFNVP